MLPILIISFFIMLFLGVPVGFSMGISSMFALISNPDLPGLVMAQKMFTATDSFTLMAIPFFMLAGQLMDESGITRDIVKFSDTLIGHIKGGLAHTTVVASTILSGISGSANADAAAIGSIMVPALKNDNYDEGFSCSVVAASAVLGPIIPPSIMMILYSSVTDMSIARLFIAGYIPGLLIAFSYMLISWRYAVKHNFASRKFAGFKAVGKSFVETLPALVLPVIIVGGILSGVFTATEAGVTATVYGLIYGFVTKKFNYRTLKKRFLDAVIATSVPMMIMSVAGMFGYILARENLPQVIVSFISGATNNGYVVYLMIMALLLFLGMFIDPTATMLMLTPVLVPLIAAYGLNPLHFAMVFILTLLTGGITPPVGLVLYIVCSIDNTPLSSCVRPIWSFVFAMMAVILIIVFVPPLVTWLPGLVLG